MLGSWRSKPVSMRRSNPPGFIKPRGSCVCECAPQKLNPSANDGPSGGAVGKPRSNCHAEGDEPARSRVQNHARAIDLSSPPSGTKNNPGLNRATQDRYSTARVSKRPTDESAACLRARYSTGAPMLLGLISIETFGFIFLAASVDRTAREVCAALMPALQSQA